MKKLMIAACTIALAAVAQAAAVNWDTGTVFRAEPDKSTTKQGALGSGYLWTVDKNTYDTILALGATGAQEYIWNNYGANEEKMASAVQMVNSNDNDNKFRSGVGMFFTEAENKSTTYAVVLFQQKAASGDTEPSWYIGNIGYTTVDEDGNVASIGELGTTFEGGHGTTSIGWSSVPAAPAPEPTSGLLLLLGVAGLALKRKRA